MSNECKDWLEDRAKQYIKADTLRDWIQNKYPTNEDYSLSIPSWKVYLDTRRIVLEELTDFIEENITYGTN